jgi:hypothetical protein
VLVSVAQALQVRLEELIEPPRAAGRLYPVSALPVRKRGDVTVRKLLPETIAGLEIERMELPPGGAMSGIPHTPGHRGVPDLRARPGGAVGRGRALVVESGRTWWCSRATETRLPQPGSAVGGRLQRGRLRPGGAG